MTTKLVETGVSAAAPVVAKRAASAFEQLLGMFWPDLLKRSHREKDMREAASIFSRAMASAAAEAATESPDLIRAMAQRLAEGEFGKQWNRLEVGAKAREHLRQMEFESDGHPSAAVDGDWMNIFSSHAERASSEGLQSIWSQVLAGEIRAPGSFSLLTLQFISVLDRSTAEAATALLGWVVDGTFVLSEVGKSLSFEHLAICRDSGLVGSFDSDVETHFDFAPDGSCFIPLTQTVVLASGKLGQRVTLHGVSLTRVARELLSVIAVDENPMAREALINQLQKLPPVQRVVSGRLRKLPDGRGQMGQVLTDWRRPPRRQNPQD